jgi:hypothetical protein
MKMYKYELHMHTSDGSLCGKSTGAEMAEYYIAHVYSGAVVSNHFYHGNTSPSRDLPWQDYVSEYARGYYSFRETVGNRDFVCFFGVEERLDGWDEYIFLGLEPEWYAAHPELRDMKGAEYLDTVRAHGGFVIHSGKTGVNGENTHVIEYALKLDSNPEFTASVLVAYARAAYGMHKDGITGCQTVFDVAPRYLIPVSNEQLRKEML